MAKKIRLECKAIAHEIAKEAKAQARIAAGKRPHRYPKGVKRPRKTEDD